MESNKSNYTTDDKRITFVESFDGSLDEYRGIIRLYRELSFGEKDWAETPSRYNQPNTRLPKELVFVEFGFNFNKQVKLTKQLRTVIFGFSFNQPNDYSKNIKVLRFDNSYNQSPILPKRITQLKLGHSFNQPILFTKKIKYLSIGCSFEQRIYMPENLDTFVWGTNSYFLVENLPSGYKRVIATYNYNLQTTNFPYKKLIAQK